MAKVWKTKRTEYYSLALKNPSRFGAYTTVCRRTVIDWCAEINGKVVCGFATKRAAMAANI